MRSIGVVTPFGLGITVGSTPTIQTKTTAANPLAKVSGTAFSLGMCGDAFD